MSMTELGQDAQDRISDAIIAALAAEGQYAVVTIRKGEPVPHADGEAAITVSWTAQPDLRPPPSSRAGGGYLTDIESGEKP
jgi:hypothetical protein